MSANRTRSGTGAARLLGLQVLIGLGIFAATLLAPAAQGTMLAVPVIPGARDGLAYWVIDAGGKLAGAGRYPGSMLVTGNRDSLFPAALSHGVLLIAAPANDCADSIKD